MSTWDIEIFSREANTDFLDELATLDDEDIVEAVEDSCKLVLSSTKLSAEEQENGLCAATIAAIWAGAPFCGRVSILAGISGAYFGRAQ